METKRIYTNKKFVFFMALFATFLWGSAFPCIKLGYDYFHIASNDTGSIILFAGVRFMFAGLLTILMGSIVAKQILVPAKNRIFGVVMLGVVLTFLQYLFYYLGMAHVGGAKGSILNSLNTLLCVIAACIYYKNEKLTKQKAIGCILGFAGVTLISLMNGTVSGGFQLRGEGFILIYAISVAIGELINKEVANNQSPIMVTGYHLTIGGILLCIIGFADHGSLRADSGIAIALLVYMIFLSAVAFTIWSVLLKYNSMSKIALYKFMIPIFGSILSAIFLKEDIFDIKFFISLICVSIGVYLVNK